MRAIASQITSLTSVYSIVYSCAHQRKRQSSALLAFAQGIHRWPVNSPHKWPVTRKMFPLDDVIMIRKVFPCYDIFSSTNTYNWQKICLPRGIEILMREAIHMLECFLLFLPNFHWSFMISSTSLRQNTFDSISVWSMKTNALPASNFSWFGYKKRCHFVRRGLHV